MEEASVEQVRSFRLRAHHLDATHPIDAAETLVGACGMQNSPPGAWETALFNRVPSCTSADIDRLLAPGGGLVQAWSLRGAPYVFPTGEADAFLTALAAEGSEPWIYTNGIGLALDFLGMDFDELLAVMRKVAPQMDGAVIESKVELDRAFAAWMRPLLPTAKRTLWDEPSMYGSPGKQTVGGAVASFLLRPLSFEGGIVFGARAGATPTFTSFRTWTGRPLKAGPDASARLVRKFLHCYGPATCGMLESWLGCSGAQSRRMWAAVEGELAPVKVAGKRAFVLDEDRDNLLRADEPARGLLLLGPHDPFLDQRDRAVLQPDQALRRTIWTTVSNPGAVVLRGEVVGVWTARSKARSLDVTATLWTDDLRRDDMRDLAEAYASFRSRRLASFEVR